MGDCGRVALSARQGPSAPGTAGNEAEASSMGDGARLQQQTLPGCRALALAPFQPKPCSWLGTTAAMTVRRSAASKSRLEGRRRQILGGRGKAGSSACRGCGRGEGHGERHRQPSEHGVRVDEVVPGTGTGAGTGTRGHAFFASALVSAGSGRGDRCEGRGSQQCHTSAAPGSWSGGRWRRPMCQCQCWGSGRG